VCHCSQFLFNAVPDIKPNDNTLDNAEDLRLETYKI
jgi:hypothetical protein